MQKVSEDKDKLKKLQDEEKETEEQLEQDEKSEVDKAADKRNATGGQSPAGSVVEEDKTHVSTEELAGSVQPKAPTHPLEVPKQPLADAFDTAEPAPEGMQP